MLACLLLKAKLKISQTPVQLEYETTALHVLLLQICNMQIQDILYKADITYLSRQVMLLLSIVSYLIGYLLILLSLIKGHPHILVAEIDCNNSTRWHHPFPPDRLITGATRIEEQATVNHK